MAFSLFKWQNFWYLIRLNERQAKSEWIKSIRMNGNNTDVNRRFKKINARKYSGLCSKTKLFNTRRQKSAFAWRFALSFDDVRSFVCISLVADRTVSISVFLSFCHRCKLLHSMSSRRRFPTFVRKLFSLFSFYLVSFYLLQSNCRNIYFFVLLFGLPTDASISKANAELISYFSINYEQKQEKNK